MKYHITTTTQLKPRDHTWHIWSYMFVQLCSNPNEALAVSGFKGGSSEVCTCAILCNNTVVFSCPPRWTQTHTALFISERGEDKSATTTAIMPENPTVGTPPQTSSITRNMSGVPEVPEGGARIKVSQRTCLHLSSPTWSS